MWRVVVVALCGATASPRRLRTQRRTTASGRATIEACDDTIYYTEVTLGGQALQLVVDTGSSDLWVAGKDCNACTQTIYDRDASPTYASDGARVEIAYADGDSVVGVAARDTLGWGGVATANQSFVEVDASNFWICGDEDGVLGLGPSAGASSAFERMASGLDAPAPGRAETTSATRLQCERMRACRREFFCRVSRTRREQSIRPKISRIDFYSTDRRATVSTPKISRIDFDVSGAREF